jgi:hypothetical protein
VSELDVIRGLAWNVWLDMPLICLFFLKSALNVVVFLDHLDNDI